MARTALSAERIADIGIEQKGAISDDPAERKPEIVVAQRAMPKKAYLEELAFNEEPVTIRLLPSAERNSPNAYYVAVNGKGCEVFRNDRWYEMAWLPVGQALTIKRKYLEVMVRAKFDSVRTEVRDPESDHPDNQVTRFTSPVHSFDIIEDANPKGVAWLAELRRRNF